MTTNHSYPLLELRKLTTFLKVKSKTYSVIQDIDLVIQKNETVALVGESGCGKSMCALSICRLIPSPLLEKITGEIWFNNMNLISANEKQMQQIRGKQLAMIFQNPSAALNPVIKIGQQIIESALYHLKLSPSQAYNKTLKIMEEVQLPRPKELIDAYPHQLSGGMQQRVMIASALICDPLLLIADEPTSALDISIGNEILVLLHRIQKARGMSILLITHDLEIVKSFADRVLIFYAGRKVEEAPSKQLLADPKHPYTIGLLQSRPIMPLKQGPIKAISGSVPSLADRPKGCLFHPRCLQKLPCCSQKIPQWTSIGSHQRGACCFLFEEKSAPPISTSTPE